MAFQSTQFHMHQSVLYNASSYFQALVDANTDEEQQQQRQQATSAAVQPWSKPIVLPSDLFTSVDEAKLFFCLLDEHQFDVITTDNIERIAYLAHYFQCALVERQCEQLLLEGGRCANLDWPKKLLVADHFHYKPLLDECAAYVARRYEFLRAFPPNTLAGL